MANGVNQRKSYEYQKSRRREGEPPKDPFDKETQTVYDRAAIKHARKELGHALPNQYNNESHSAYIRRVARHYGPDMIDVLAFIAKDGRQPAGARVSAALGILDRAYGKPTQTIETIKAQGALHEIPTETLVQLIKQATVEKVVSEAVQIQGGDLTPALPEPEVIASDGKERI